MSTLAGQMAVTTLSSAALTSGNFSTAQQATLLTTLQGINIGSFSIPIDGTVRQTGTMDFTAVASLANVATLINATLSAWATFTWQPGNPGTFRCQSLSTGSGSSISYAAAGTGGTNISGLLNLTAGNGATIAAPPGAQWVLADGKPYYALDPTQSMRTAAGVSKGSRADYIRNVGWRGRRRGLGPLGWIVCMPVTPGYGVSTADDSSEPALTPPVYTVANPPPGTK